MKGRRTAAWMVLAALGATSGPSAAQERSDSAEIAELRVRIDALTRELERLQLGGDVVVADSSVLGFGPAASRVYRVQRGVSLGGYGEVLYENFAAERQDGSPSGSSDRLGRTSGHRLPGIQVQRPVPLQLRDRVRARLQQPRRLGLRRVRLS